MEQQMSKVALSAVQLAKKQPPGSKGTAVEIKTNVVRIGLKPNIPFYKYDQRVYVVFKTNDGEEKLKELTKQTRDDYTEQDRKNATVRIYKKLLEQEKKFFGDGHSLFYDRAACLYTLKQLDVNGEKKIELPANYISGFEDAVGFRVVIKKAADSFQSNTNEILKTAKALPGEEDRTLLEVLNIIVGQAPLMNTGDFITYGNGTHYLYQPDMKVFRREDIPALRDGKYIGVGCNKAVKILEGPNGTPVPMTVIDVKKTAFHIDNQNLYDKITQLSIFRGSPTDNDINARKKSIIDQIKRLVVMTIYGKKKQVFPISGIAPIGAGGCMIEHAGKKMSIAQYFQSKYSIHLKHPSVFMVIGRIGQRDNMYPIELLEVAPNQRVTGSQQTPEQISKMGIADPIDRSRQTEAMRKSVQLNNTNPYIKQAGISVEDHFTTVQARLLPSPLLRVGDNKMVTVERNHVWRNNGKFYDSKTLAKWTVYAQLVGRDADSAGMVSEYVKRLVSMGLSKGMKIAQPVRIDIEKNPNDCAVKQYMSQSRANGMQLVFIITSDQITLHNFIKKEEALQDMLTQEIKFSKLASTVQKNQAQTLENVIMKTNAKLGGLSKLILSGTDQKTQMWLNDPARLFFGFEFSHPAPLTPWEKERGEKHGKPSVVGYAANVQKNHQYYLGGYDYLPAHVPEALEDKLQEIFEENIRLCRSNRNVVPNHLVVYFNGISEGQFILVADNYLKKIRAACSKICEQYKPKMTLIAAMKGHNERFYNKVVQGKNASEQNIPPGIVIDRHVISPTITEFFLNPHNAFKGTAKTPKYSVLYDDSSMPQDVIQGMTHGLCFGHDIVNSTISVPVPLIVADRYAKRGANNFTEYNNCEASGEINIEKAAQDISYNKNILKNVRYNA